MAVYVCRRCGFERSEEWEGLCPGCGGPYRSKRLGVDSASQGGFSTLGGGRSKSSHNYLSTGQAGFDYVLGGGLVAGKVVLVGGFAGVGKTRLLLTVADYIAKTQGPVIYASGEESADDINNTAAHLGIVNNRVTVMGNQCSVEKVLDHAKKIRAFLALYDSAQKFASDFSSGSPGSGVQCKAIGEAIRSYSSQSKTCSIIVNQMSGDGSLKGGTELEHHCDTIMVFAYPKDDDEDAPNDKGIRGLYGSKNRCGPENLTSYWKMHGPDDPTPGHLEHVPARPKVIEEPRRSKYSRRG